MNSNGQENRNAGDDDRAFHLGVGGQNIEKRKSDVGLKEFYKRSPHPHEDPHFHPFFDCSFRDRDVDRTEWYRP